MEKDIGKIMKNENTDIVVRVDDFGGKIGITIREFTTGERYTGFTKSGTRIPAEKFFEFRELINKISLDDLRETEESEGEKQEETAKAETETKKEIKKEKSEEEKDQTNLDEIEEEVL